MNAVYVDDEKPAIAKFKATVAQISDISAFNAFTRADTALEYIRDGNKVDIAFLDIEMPGMNGIQLANEIHGYDKNIKIVFVTAYDSYALDAFGVDAVGYLLKPYKKEMMQKIIDKAKLIMPIPNKKVYIQTMPNFDVFIDGKLFPINSAKPKELLAILVDKNGGTITSGLAISYLWEDRCADQGTQSLYRMTVKRLKEILADGGIDFILGSDGQQRYINPHMFECDYYKLLAGDKDAEKKYDGEYMSEYEWAEDTNARLSRITGGE